MSAAPRPSGYAPTTPDDLDDAWPDAGEADEPELADAPRAGGPREANATRPAGRRAAAPGRRGHVSRPPAQDPSELFGPAWERPHRYEAYPSLRTRVGLPSLGGGIPRLGVAVIALVFAAGALFFVGPMLLGIGGQDVGSGTRATPIPTAAQATPTAEPTAPPAPTPRVYIVAKGDNMSRIAKKFGVTVDQILAANPKVKNADRIKEGQKLTIPVPVVEDLPDAGEESAAP
jgi:hypothetical protein